jgi:hypothetical protein
MLCVDLVRDLVVHPVVKHQAVQAAPGQAAVDERTPEGKLLGQVIAELLGEVSEGEVLEERPV